MREESAAEEEEDEEDDEDDRRRGRRRGADERESDDEDGDGAERPKRRRRRRRGGRGKRAGRRDAGELRPRRGGLRAVARPRDRRRPRLHRALGRPPPGRGHGRARPDRDHPGRRRRRPRRTTTTRARTRTRQALRRRERRARAAARRRGGGGRGARGAFTGWSSQASTGTRARVLTRSSSERRSLGSAPSSSSLRMLALRTAVEASSNRNTAIPASCSVGSPTGIPPSLADLAQRRDQRQALARRPPGAAARAAGARRPRGAARRARPGSRLRRPLRGRKSAGVPRRNERIMWTQRLPVLRAGSRAAAPGARSRAGRAAPRRSRARASG